MKKCKKCSSELGPADRACPACGAPVPKSKALWWILGCLGAGFLFLLAAGCVVALVVPKLVKKHDSTTPAQSRSLSQEDRQARAMQEIQVLAEALRAYRRDNGAYPVLEVDPAMAFDMVDVAELGEVLVPDYLERIPAQDPWGNPYQYAATAEGDHILLLSVGSDGRRRIQSVPTEPRGTSCYQDDIVWLDEQFVRRPRGPQQDCGGGS